MNPKPIPPLPAPSFPIEPNIARTPVVPSAPLVPSKQNPGT